MVQYMLHKSRIAVECDQERTGLLIVSVTVSKLEDYEDGARARVITPNTLTHHARCPVR